MMTFFLKKEEIKMPPGDFSEWEASFSKVYEFSPRLDENMNYLQGIDVISLLLLFLEVTWDIEPDSRDRLVKCRFLRGGGGRISHHPAHFLPFFSILSFSLLDILYRVHLNISFKNCFLFIFCFERFLDSAKLEFMQNYVKLYVHFYDTKNNDLKIFQQKIKKFMNIG